LYKNRVIELERQSRDEGWGMSRSAYMAESAEGYQARAVDQDPKEIAQATIASMKMVARMARWRGEGSQQRPSPKDRLWDEELGPFYSVRQVAELLQFDEDKVIRMTEDGELLGLHTSDGIIVFPAFAIDNAMLGQQLSMIFATLKSSGVDDWTAAAWLVGGHDALQGHSAVSWLVREKDYEPLIFLARDAARRFAT
jgi:hypothetical protein